MAEIVGYSKNSVRDEHARNIKRILAEGGDIESALVAYVMKRIGNVLRHERAERERLGLAQRENYNDRNTKC